MNFYINNFQLFLNTKCLLQKWYFYKNEWFDLPSVKVNIKKVGTNIKNNWYFEAKKVNSFLFMLRVKVNN